MPGSKKNKLPNSLLTASPHPKWCEGGDGLGEGTTTAEDWEKWWLMAHASIPKAKWHWSAWHRRGNAKPWPRSPCLGPVFCITVRCLWAAAGMLSVRWFCSLHYWNRSGQKQDKNNRLPIILSLRISYPEGNSLQSLCPQQGEDLWRSSALEEEELLEGLATPPWIGGQDNVQGLWRGWWLHLWRKAGVKDNREPMLGRGRSPHERKGLQAPGPDLFGELGCDLLWVMLHLSYLVVQSSTLVLPLATTS